MEFAFPILIVLATLGFIVYQRASMRQKWEHAAQTLGLTFKSSLLGSATLQGRYSGAPVKIYTVSRGGKNNRKTYTVFEIGLPPRTPGKLVIAKEGVLASLGKFVGMQDIEIGESIFDSTFVIKGQNPAAVKRFLSRPCVTDEILELYNKHPQHFEIKDGTLTLEVLGVAPSYEIELTLDSAIKMFDAMRGKPAQQNQAESRPQRSGPFGGRPEQAQPAPQSPPPSAGDGRFGPPSDLDDSPAANDGNARRPAPDPSQDQPDDWW